MLSLLSLTFWPLAGVRCKKGSNQNACKHNILLLYDLSAWCWLKKFGMCHIIMDPFSFPDNLYVTISSICLSYFIKLLKISISLRAQVSCNLHRNMYINKLCLNLNLPKLRHHIPESFLPCLINFYNYLLKQFIACGTSAIRPTHQSHYQVFFMFCSDHPGVSFQKFKTVCEIEDRWQRTEKNLCAKWKVLKECF